MTLSLSPAQERYLLSAEWRSPDGFSDRCCMTFPPPNTHRVLMREGLVDQDGVVTKRGLDVRLNLIAPMPRRTRHG